MRNEADLTVITATIISSVILVDNPHHAITMTTTSTVQGIKTALSKELPCDELSDDSLERCRDLLQRLDELPIDLKVLQKTLVGTVVSKFKTHETLGPMAKSLVKKWKKMAKQGVASTAPAQANDSTDANALAEMEAEWGDLPPLRKNICKKLHDLLGLSRKEMVKSGINADAFTQLVISRAAEVEAAIHTKLGRDKQRYTEKARSLCFNIKKNSALRSSAIMGSLTGENIVDMSSEELATSEKKAARDAEVNKLRDSRRLDWEQANEKKINDMCGIKGELLSASLFTCGRCKSTKTTSTQKQTRSADEPMTVFVLCMNCGKRWKC